MEAFSQLRLFSDSSSLSQVDEKLPKIHSTRSLCWDLTSGQDQQAESKECWRLVSLLFFLFLFSLGLSPYSGVIRIQGGSLLRETFLEMSMPRVCLLGASRSSPIDEYDVITFHLLVRVLFHLTSGFRMICIKL